MNEIWKNIAGYEGLYEVSSFGRVRSLRFGKTKILKPGKNKKGYLRVSLCKNGKQKTFFVHRLVAQAFLENPQNLPQINHKDENKQNNRLENLEWCSCDYNNNYGTRNERAGKANRGRTSAMKGKHHSEESKRKTSIDVKNNLPKTAFKKGNKPWNAGTRGLVKAWNRRRVLQYTKDMVFVAKFDTVKEAIEKNGILNISAVARGKFKTAGGYIWKYENPEK